MTLRWYSVYLTSYLGQLSLAILPWVGAVSTGHSHCSGTQDELCIVVCPVSRTGGLLTWSKMLAVDETSHPANVQSYASLAEVVLAFTDCMCHKGDELPRSRPQSMGKLILFLLLRHQLTQILTAYTCRAIKLTVTFVASHLSSLLLPIPIVSEVSHCQ